MIEGVLLSVSPDEWDVFLGEVMQGSADLGEVLDEVSAEIGEPNEASNILKVLGS